MSEMLFIISTKTVRHLLLVGLSIRMCVQLHFITHSAEFGVTTSSLGRKFSLMYLKPKNLYPPKNPKWKLQCKNQVGTHTQPLYTIKHCLKTWGVFQRQEKPPQPCREKRDGKRRSSGRASRQPALRAGEVPLPLTRWLHRYSLLTHTGLLGSYSSPAPGEPYRAASERRKGRWKECKKLQEREGKHLPGGWGRKQSELSPSLQCIYRRF